MLTINKLEEKIFHLEKKLAKGEQYSFRNNVEITGIPNSIPDEDLENTVVNICKGSGVEIDPKDIEGCHKIPLLRTEGKIRMIVKSVYQKHLETLLGDKKQIKKQQLQSFEHSQ